LPAEYDFQFYVECIDSVIKEISFKNKLIAYSYSYGSAALYRYVIQNELIFKCLIFGGATMRFTESMVSEMRILIELAETDEKLFKQEYLDKFVNNQLNPSVLKRTKILLKHALKSITSKEINSFAHNHRRLLRQHEVTSYIHTPTLAMIGEYDRFTKFSDLENLEKNFSQITTVKLRDCDHFYPIPFLSISL